MKLTKDVNIFDQTERGIRCIAKEHDYLGTGEMIVEQELEVGKIYTFLYGRAASYGNMVFLKELPSRWGYQAYLFEELEPYDEDICLRKSREWLLEKIDAGVTDAKRGKAISADELEKHMENLLRQEPFEPCFTEGHDPGAAYWIYPAHVRDNGRIEYSDIEEFKAYEISIPDRYFDGLLTDFFTDGIDPELPINAHRYSTDDIPEGVSIYGFAWYLHPNFYTYEQMNQILIRLHDTAAILRSGHLDQLPSRQRSRLRKEFAAVDENEYETTYADAMKITADYYDKLVERIRRMMAECTQTDILCVMTP